MVNAIDFRLQNLRICDFCLFREYRNKYIKGRKLEEVLKVIKINPDITPPFSRPQNFENTISILRFFLNCRHKLQ